MSTAQRDPGAVSVDRPTIGTQEDRMEAARQPESLRGHPLMSSAGLSKTRLGRLREVMAGFVERGEVPGLVALISRRGEIHVEALGTKALDGGDPVERDTIFRIASMTKPITAGAAMILVEECKLRLDDPVDPILPELADRRVPKQLDGPLDDTHRAGKAADHLARFADLPHG